MPQHFETLEFWLKELYQTTKYPVGGNWHLQIWQELNYEGFIVTNVNSEQLAVYIENNLGNSVREVLFFAINPKFWGQGLSHCVWQFWESKRLGCEIWLETTSKTCCTILQIKGLKITGERPNYYGPSEDALLLLSKMVKCCRNPEFLLKTSNFFN
ncbi:MAG: hypothetical protein R2827_08835 [Bdellovibrionales bacterium]